MTATADETAAADRVRDTLARQGLLRTLGVEVVEVEPGRVVLDLPVRPEVAQQDGFVHAGAVTALADAAAGAAAQSMMPAGKNVLSVEFKVNLLSPGVGERLRAAATVVRSGRTITVVTAAVESLGGADATTGSGKPVALMQATMIAVDAAAADRR
ncbi:PaaI family thioesterase [Streptacidiphilus sp. ASG 303]|uniref:PaaI family thioesterase n=1 Tax=Streptomycetaceae TaxID=2062 RepID=UPI001E567A79|nr:PaaI family thioesterase [Streptacidiphilus sp. ASG 303]MCD0483488.1 PaaI family thioesterase [Streptacidiphilus sp. ASG 303]